MIKQKQTKLSVKQKSPHVRGPLVEIMVFSVVAGEGFEPPTFGLWARRKYSNMWIYGNVWPLYDQK